MFVVPALASIILCLVEMKLRTAALGVGLGLVVGYIGICLMTNATSCCIEWRHNTLKTVEQVGWLRWTRRCNASKVSKFIHLSSFSEATEPIERLISKGDCHLALELSHREELFGLVYSYPRSVLEQVADELTWELEATYKEDELRVSDLAITDADSSSKAQSPVASKAFKSGATIDVLEEAQYNATLRKPVDTRLEVEVHEHAIVFKTLPKGFWEGSGELARFCATMIFLSGYIAFIPLVGLFQGIFNWQTWCFAALFCVGSFKLWEHCYSTGRSAVTIGASPDLIWIDQTVGVKDNEIHEFEVSEIERITSGLAFQKVDGSRCQVSTTLSADELKWIAFEMERYLGLDEPETKPTNPEL